MSYVQEGKHTQHFSLQVIRVLLCFIEAILFICCLWNLYPVNYFAHHFQIFLQKV